MTDNRPNVGGRRSMRLSISRPLWLREPPQMTPTYRTDGVNRAVLRVHRMSGFVIAMVEQQLDVMIRGALRSTRPGSVYYLPDQP